MSREEKAAHKLAEKTAAAAAAALRVASIAAREYRDRGGYQRILPPDFESGYLQHLVDGEPQQRAVLEEELAALSRAADEVCASTR
jgi:hypothetical protein